MAFWAGLLAMALVSTMARASTQTIQVLHVAGTIVPVVADYIDQGIAEAEARGNTIVIIELSTPGGLMTTTQKIVERILNARVPVVVYVSPSGGWAGSAGTYITLASHVAAMAPGSRIGAATPVTMEGQQISEEMKRKVTEDAIAWIKSISELRGRNAEQAALAVSEGKSYTVTEALQYRLIDLKADSLEDLIEQLNGMKVTLASREEMVLNTQSYALVRENMTIVERFLHTISDPNIAYVLLSLGTIGIIAEIYNPGAMFPGIIGAISLLLAFYSLGVLNAQWGGILLILLAFGLFIAEVFTPGFGLLTAGGIVSLVLGSIMLFPRGEPMLQVSPWLIAVVVIIVVLVFAFVINRIVIAQRHQATTGREELVGKTAIAKQPLEPEGIVLFKGELWTAISDKGKIRSGEEVIITRVDGLKLHVTRKEQ
ncbi:MAG: nodulation protein NfeD [Chloroflexota bacterium]|nr:nodulation protein NfeD [Chloroflexota bacterium]